MAEPPPLRIFISSPGDVAAAREVAAQTIERAAQDYRQFLTVESYLWENEAMLASGHFQDSIDPPSKFDIVILILGGRLGTPLPERTAVREYRGIDGRAPVTGTEWEFEDALLAARERGAPDLLVYRSRQDIKISAVDVAAQHRQLQQLEALNAFWARHFADQGAFIGAYSSFDDLERLSASIERDLHTLIRKRVERLGSAAADVTRPVWLKQPFRGLESYEFEHAPIFFGRDEAIGRAMLRLLRRAEAGEPFLLVMGASGSGKSSLVKAGLAPRLYEPRRVPETFFLRRVVFRPGEVTSGEDIFSALARRLTLRPEGASADVGLPELLGPSMTFERLADHLRDAHADPSFVFERCLDDLAARAKAQGRMLEYQRPKLLLVADQLEELFTSESISDDDRRRFVSVLSALLRSGSAYVLATMRSDLWRRAAEIPELVRLAEGDGRLDLAGPSTAEISQMIRRPARAGGLTFEVDPETAIPLDDRIAEEAANQPGALPLLSFLMETLYLDRAGAMQLTYEAFERAGRMEGAIAATAERVLASQPLEVREALSRVLFALVQIASPDDASTSRPVAKQVELAKFPMETAERRLIEALASARLVVMDRGDRGDGVVRLAHEALITYWAAARTCVERNAESMGVRSMVEERLKRSRSLDQRAESGLLVGPDLADARALASEFGTLLGDELTAFIERSTAADERARRSRRLRATGLSAAVFALAAGLAIAIWAAISARNASEVQRIDRQLLRDERAASTDYAQGRLPRASAGFMGDERLAMQLVQMDPTEPQWRYNLAASQAYAAYTLAKLGDNAGTAREYHGALATLAGLAQRDSSNPKVQAERKALQSLLRSRPPIPTPG